MNKKIDLYPPIMNKKIDLYPPIMSTRSLGMRFTAQGLGDRIHLVSLAYQVSRLENCFATLHLAANHTEGGKTKSFYEIVSLFPQDLIDIQIHDSFFSNNYTWGQYLKSRTKNLKSFGYRDHPGWLERDFEIDASRYLLNRFLISPSCMHEVCLPDRYVTAQWDATGEDRRLESSVINRIEKNYKDWGYEIVTVGGQSHSRMLRECLRCCANAIGNSEFFIGVDSGFMHLALQTLEPSKIRIFTDRNRFWSHHLFQALDLGASAVSVRSKTGRFNMFEKWFIKLRYDSPRLIGLIHRLRDWQSIRKYENND